MPDETSPKPFVFVLMPFAKVFDDIYQVGIKQACKDAGAYCERVDEQIFTESILERVYNQIAKADIIVADMTGRNPNVFYETGYAHALNKRVILLTQNIDDIPFDLKFFPHIVYGGSITRLKSELEKRIVWGMENPKSSLGRADFAPQISIDGHVLDNNPVVDLLFNPGFAQHSFQIDVQNPTDRMFVAESKIDIFLPFDCPIAGDINLPDGGKLLHAKKIGRMLPRSWEKLVLDLTFASSVKEGTHQLCVRFYTEIGFKEFPFQLRIAVNDLPF